MWMCYQQQTYWPWWPMMVSRGLTLAAMLAVGGCAALISGDESEIKADLRASLASEPSACSDYRAAYVDGFETHVAGLSADREALTQAGRKALEQSRSILKANGLEREDCTRPNCIIEPLDAGKLDSWCGFRVDRSDGPEVFQWFEWSKVENDA